MPSPSASVDHNLVMSSLPPDIAAIIKAPKKDESALVDACKKAIKAKPEFLLYRRDGKHKRFLKKSSRLKTLP